MTKTKEAQPLDDLAVRRLAATMRSLGEPKRLRMVLAVAQAGATLTVGELADLMGMASSATSAHLAMLRHTGILEAHSAGQHVRYALAATNSQGGIPALAELAAVLTALVGPIPAELTALLRVALGRGTAAPPAQPQQEPVDGTTRRSRPRKGMQATPSL